MEEREERLKGEGRKIENEEERIEIWKRGHRDARQERVDREMEKTVD